MNLTAQTIKIEFSQDGNFLAILIDNYQFSLYEVNESPYSLMKQIKKEQKVFSYDFEDDFDKIIFCRNSEYIAIWSD